MHKRYGASDEEWDAFIKLSPMDIRPSVSDPSLQKLPQSVVNDPSKVPTVAGVGKYEGFYYGIRNWVTKVVSDVDLDIWRNNPAHNICLVGNVYKALDLDIESMDEANKIQAMFEFHFGRTPCRRRPGTPRRVLMFKLKEDIPLRKVVIKTANGAVELLGNKQQFMVAGTHWAKKTKIETRYFWEHGLPTREDVPEVSLYELKEFMDELNSTFGVNRDALTLEDGTSLEVSSRNKKQLMENDDELKFILESEYFREFLPDGKVAVKCPFEYLHASSNGEYDGNASATVYMPKGLGGMQSSGFKCMHASHGEITVEKFLNEIGYVPGELKEISVFKEEEEEDYITPPCFLNVNKAGDIPATTPNIILALQRPDWLGIALRFDTFTSKVEVLYKDRQPRQWMPLADNDYTEITLALMTKSNFKQPTKDVLRSCVFNAATKNAVDSAIEWINTLKWDGVERIKHFAKNVLHSKGTDYENAVVNYMFTALAGRVITPGVKADMVPVLISRQGMRKTTFVSSLVPKESEWSGEINFSLTDSDNARAVQGKVIIELPELKGLTSKAEEHIKAWITRTSDSWVPKFMEQPVTYHRRFLMIGTTNHEKFLSDSTGNRRWLPINVAADGQPIDIDYINKHLTQLWAEAKHMYLNHGVMWQEAERLGEEATKNHISEDAWTGIIKKWLALTDIDEDNARSSYSVDEILTIALKLQPSQITRGNSSRVERILSSLGWIKDTVSERWVPAIN